MFIYCRLHNRKSHYATLSIPRRRSAYLTCCLNEGDKLDWSWGVRNNDMVVVIRKTESYDMTARALKTVSGSVPELIVLHDTINSCRI